MKDESSFDINNETNPVQTVAPTNKEENEMIGATDKITALYCRLSVEDTKDDKKKGNEDPSDSIQHQQLMLMQYAKSNRFPNPTVFIDDGFSGVTYDRPGFQKMMAEIEAGNVGTVITKDLSRLGRNSALTGLYINYTFPQYGVRYIAVNDHFDTINPNSTDSDMAGIRNWFKNTPPSRRVNSYIHPIAPTNRYTTVTSCRTCPSTRIFSLTTIRSTSSSSIARSTSSTAVYFRTADTHF